MFTKLYLDVESVGLCGPVKLIQFSIDRGPVQFIRIFGPNGSKIMTEGELRNFKLLFNLMSSPDTLFIGWNTAYDLWQLYRLYHIYLNGSFGKEDEKTVQPFHCKTLDLYLHAIRKGPYAAFAFAARRGPRATAVVRRVPRVAQQHVINAVLDRLRPVVPGDLSVSEHEVSGKKELVTLSFNLNVGRLGLKAHAEYWGFPVIKLQDVWPLPKFEEKPWLRWWDERYLEVEQACDAVLEDSSSEFYKYAENDIKYLWLAEDKLSTGPECSVGGGDVRRDDLVVPDCHDTATHIVAYTRYHGFDTDREVLDRTVNHYSSQMETLENDLTGIDLASWQSKVKALQALNPLIKRANKGILEALSKGNDKAAELARKMILYGPAKQKLDQARKVKEAVRLYASLRILGAATGRAAGEGSFNVQGIGKPERTGDGFTVGLREAIRTGAVGDFHQFELAIAAAAWGDEQMLSDLTNKVDIHLATAVDCHPKLIGKIDYTEAKKAKSKEAHPMHSLVVKCRTECKRMVFGILYGCTAQKIMEVFGVDEAEANRILERFYTRYPGIRKFKTSIERAFCTADTVTWKKESVATMRDSETDLTGYTRRWTFEKTVACIMWDLGQRWKSTGLVGTVVRQTAKGDQSIDNACRSAFLGAAIAIQQAVFRQAANMRIQTTGAMLCMMLGAELWDKFHVPMINVHDEWVFAQCPWFEYDKVTAHCKDFCERHKSIVPHIRFDLGEVERWSEKE